MELPYQQPQPYPLYETPQWSGDSKPVFVDRENETNRDHTSTDAVSPSDFSSVPHSRRPSMLKVEADYAIKEGVWHDRPQDPHYPTRHFSHPQMSVNHPHGPSPFLHEARSQLCRFLRTPSDMATVTFRNKYSYSWLWEY